MVCTYIRKGGGPPDPELLKRAVRQVINENSYFQVAVKEFSLKKSTLVDAMKCYKSKTQDLEHGTSSTNNDNDCVHESSKFVFTSKQEKELVIYLKKCSIC